MIGDMVADKAIGGADLNMAGSASSIDQNGTDGGVERIADIDLLETEFLFQLFAGLFRVARRRTLLEHIGLQHRRFDGAPAATTGTLVSVVLGELSRFDHLV